MLEKKTRPAAKQGARNVLSRENSRSVSLWTPGAQIALALPILLGMAATAIAEVIA